MQRWIFLSSKGYLPFLFPGRFCRPLHSQKNTNGIKNAEVRGIPVWKYFFKGCIIIE